MFKNILVAHDGSDGARKAFTTALQLCAATGGRLHMISVEEDLPLHAQTIGEVAETKADEDSYFQRLADLAKREAANVSVPFQHTILAGHEVRTIIDFAVDQSFDLLVIGFTGHSRIYERLWGGTSQNLARLAPCSVLVVK